MYLLEIEGSRNRPCGPLHDGSERYVPDPLGRRRRPPER